jgi:hypothetical protein
MQLPGELLSAVKRAAQQRGVSYSYVQFGKLLPNYALGRLSVVVSTGTRSSFHGAGNSWGSSSWRIRSCMWWS